jgi:uncharacterized protein YeaO (DUF488 family)
MAARKAVIRVKRVYEKASPSDGKRVLVDRLWPRGLKKQEVRIDAWLRDLAPSNELRKWFHSHPTEEKEFRQRYVEELHGTAPGEARYGLEKLIKNQGKVTLLFASKNVEYNNATVLREIVEAAEAPAIPKSSARTPGGRTRPLRTRRPARKSRTRSR